MIPVNSSLRAFASFTLCAPLHFPDLGPAAVALARGHGFILWHFSPRPYNISRPPVRAMHSAERLSSAWVRPWVYRDFQGSRSVVRLCLFGRSSVALGSVGRFNSSLRELFYHD